MRIRGAGLLLCGLAALCMLLAPACGAASIFRQYEYEEEMYLSLDGTATLYVNSSIAALNALHGTSFDASPAARFDREPFRAYFDTPLTHVTKVSQSRHSNRRFVHVRMDVDDVNRLGTAPPFAWSSYAFGLDDNQFVYRQTVGAAANRAVPDAHWTGKEIVAFRLHLPSKINFQNTDAPRRGNILVWEQPLADRLHSVPLTLEARMQTQSILYRTLWLFGATFAAVAISFVAVIWWILRKGRAGSPPPGQPGVSVR